MIAISAASPVRFTSLYMRRYPPSRFSNFFTLSAKGSGLRFHRELSPTPNGGNAVFAVSSVAAAFFAKVIIFSAKDEVPSHNRESFQFCRGERVQRKATP
ncbi:MAG: hypothetical protein ACLUKN_07640 [Bacilli bacterium]